MASTDPNLMDATDQTEYRKMKPLNINREKQKLAIQKTIADKRIGLNASNNDLMDDFTVPEYITTPNPKRGEGAFTPNLLFPPEVPNELRDQIYQYLVVAAGTISLKWDADIYQRLHDRHIEDCPHAGEDWGCGRKFFMDEDYHRFHEGEYGEDGRKEVICIDPGTKKHTAIKFPNTVLNYRLVCKEVNREIAPVFWLNNKFAFVNADDASSQLRKLTTHIKSVQTVQLKYSLRNSYGSYVDLIGRIRHIRICFTPRKAGLYTSIAAEFLTGLHSLELMLFHDYPHLIFDKSKDPLVGRGRNPLSKAKHIDTFAKAFSKHTGPCKNILKVDVIGTDLVRRLTPNEDEDYYVEVDINHAEAIGPVIRENILRVKEPWVSGKELKLAEEVRKKKAAAAKKAAEELRERNKLAAIEKGQQTRRNNREKAILVVQTAQADLQWQRLGRGYQGYDSVPVAASSAFVGPINVPRRYCLYSDWIAGNGNTPADATTPPNHGGVGSLDKLQVFQKFNGYVGHAQPRQGPLGQTQNFLPNRTLGSFTRVLNNNIEHVHIFYVDPVPGQQIAVANARSFVHGPPGFNAQPHNFQNHNGQLSQTGIGNQMNGFLGPQAQGSVGIPAPLNAVANAGSIVYGPPGFNAQPHNVQNHNGQLSQTGSGNQISYGFLGPQAQGSVGIPAPLNAVANAGSFVHGPPGQPFGTITGGSLGVASIPHPTLIGQTVVSLAPANLQPAPIGQGYNGGPFQGHGNANNSNNNTSGGLNPQG